MKVKMRAVSAAQSGGGTAGLIFRTIFHMQRKIFWTVFLLLGLLADFLLPIWWALAATIPIIVIAWWVAYRSDWF